MCRELKRGRMDGFVRDVKSFFETSTSFLIGIRITLVVLMSSSCNFI